MRRVGRRSLGVLLTAVLASPLLPVVGASANLYHPCGRDKGAGVFDAPDGLASSRGATERSAPASAGWPKFRYNAAGSGANPNESILNVATVPSLIRKWHAATAGPIESAPAVAGGVVYVGSNDMKVYAFDELVGKQLWSYKTGGMVTSSPAVAAGVVFVGSEDGDVYALNATTGALVWRHPTGAGVHSSPNVVGGKVYVGSRSGELLALSASDGHMLWSFKTGGPITSSPAVFTQVDGTVAVYVGSGDGSIYARDAAKGTSLWRFATKGAVESSPAVVNWNGKDLLVAGSDDFNIYGLNADTGAKKWVCKTHGIAISSPAISLAMGRAYWGTNGWDIQGHNLSDGLTAWNFTCGAAARSSPALANGVVYSGCGKDDHIYAFRETFSGETGVGSSGSVGPEGVDRLKRMIWQFDTGGDVFSSPAVSDGMVFIGSYTGELSAFGLR